MDSNANLGGTISLAAWRRFRSLSIGLGDVPDYLALNRHDDVSAVLRTHLFVEHWLRNLEPRLVADDSCIRLGLNRLIVGAVEIGAIEPETERSLLALETLRTCFVHDLTYQLCGASIGIFIKLLRGASLRVLEKSSAFSTLPEKAQLRAALCAIAISVESQVRSYFQRETTLTAVDYPR